MQISLKHLLIYVAFVGLILGQARLPAIVGCLCLSFEILLLMLLVRAGPLRWLTLGVLTGQFAGMAVWGAVESANQPALPTGLDVAAYQAELQGHIQRFQTGLAYAFQLGALIGGTLGLIVGLIRNPSPQPGEPIE